MTFAADFEKLGKVENHELKPGGAEIPVTEENKEEYIAYVLLVLWLFLMSFGEIFQKCSSRLKSVVPRGRAVPDCNFLQYIPFVAV